MKPGIKFLILIFLIGFSSHLKAQDTLANWNFNESAGKTTLESKSKTLFNLTSVRNNPEHVVGAVGNGFRTDGYSSWAVGTLNTTLPLNIISISAWIALESYPNATASIWSDFDVATNKGIEFGINKFGNLQLSITQNGLKNIIENSEEVPHQKWVFVAASVNTITGKVNLYVNGNQSKTSNIPNGNITWPALGAKMYIGRSAADSLFNNLYPKTVLNGIIDQVILWNKELNTAELSTIYKTQKPPNDPDLLVAPNRFANDFSRPKFHALPDANWTNESHGLIYFNGTYHLFHQRNANGPYLDHINWGHLESSDLLNWKSEPVAIWPQRGFDQVGIWAGHLVLNNNIPNIIYTGVDGQKAAIGTATSNDNLQSFTKNASNPVISGSPSTYPNNDFRDPYVFKENGNWYMIVGSGLSGSIKAGTVFLYKSADLQTWQSLGPMFTGNPSVDGSGSFWEVPVFWKFGSKYVLLINKVPEIGTPAKAIYWIGNFVNEKFIPDRLIPQNLEVINVLLSPSVNLDENGRVTAIGIIPDLMPQNEQYKRGWANLFSLPREWKLRGDSILIQAPHPSLRKLRGAKKSFKKLNITESASNYLANSSGHQLEIEASIKAGTANQVGVIIGESDDGSEQTKIYYDYQTKQVIVDRSKSSKNTNVPRDVMNSFLDLPKDSSLTWRIYIDGSAVDVFINDEYAFATRIFPSDNNSEKIDLFTKGGIATTDSVNVYTLDKSAQSNSNSSMKVSATDATCQSSNNGIIKVFAGVHQNYSATITGPNFSKNFSFSDSLVVQNLPPTNYNICVQATASPTDIRCFQVAISAPADLSVYTAYHPNDNILTLTLLGGNKYTINLNNQIYITTDNFIDLPLLNGTNQLRVETDKLCQGVFLKTFEVNHESQVYPNPFKDKINVNLSGQFHQPITLSIRSLNGEIVYSKNFISSDTTDIAIDLSFLQSAYYMLSLDNQNGQTSFKILKK